MTTVAADSRRARAVTTSSTALSTRAIAVVLALLAFPPIANWIPGGHEADWYSFIANGFVSGTTIALGVGVVLGILSGKIAGL